MTSQVLIESQVDIESVVRALGAAMARLTHEEQEKHLRNLFDDLWDTSAEKKKDFIARVNKAAKDAVAEREQMNLDYGGNVAHRYKKAQGFEV